MTAHLHRAPADCPVCGERLAVSRLGCPGCGTELVGSFAPCAYCALGDAERALLTDPQTSGGLLVACAPDVADEVLALFRQQGFDRATVIGEMAAGEAKIRFNAA